MVHSKNKTDQRFINMVRLQNSKKYGVHIGFKGFKKSQREKQKELDTDAAFIFEPRESEDPF